jgi:arylsulfatase A-like enzyme
MAIYPTLTDLAGIDKPSHVEAKSIRPLLVDAKAEWATPAVTTHEQGNHAVRSEGWRYIRYANGDEELYDETADPYEWKNLARDAKYAEQKAALAKHLPTTNKPDLSSGPDGEGKKHKAAGGKNRSRKQQRKEQAPQ